MTGRNGGNIEIRIRNGEIDKRGKGIGRKNNREVRKYGGKTTGTVEMREGSGGKRK